MTQNFISDVQQERILTPIVVKEILTDFLQKHNLHHSLIDFDSNPNAQYAGIDFVMGNNDKSWNVDLKCQTNKYIGNPTKTFCLEVLYEKDYEEKQGWFIQEGNETDYYLFGWIQSANVGDDGVITSLDQINKMDLMFVYKKDVLKFIEECGYDKERLLEEAREMVRNGETKKKIPTMKGRPLRLVRSMHLNEKPVNIVLSKSTYDALENTKHLLYTKQNGMTELKRGVRV